jgi:hypothetical protein
MNCLRSKPALAILAACCASLLAAAPALQAADCARVFARFAGADSAEEFVFWSAAKSAGRRLRILAGPSVPRAKPLENGGWADSALSFLQAYAVPTGKALLPFPLPRNLGRGEVYAIYRKVWKNPEVMLEESERAILAARQMTESLEEFRALLRENPRSVKARRILDTSATAALGVGSAAGIIHFVNQAEQGVISSESFLKDAQYRLGEWQIQLLNETVPFPHLAVRMGERVYSYGESHMTVTSVVHYLEEQKFADLWRRQNPELAGDRSGEERAGSSSRSLSSSLLKIGEATGLSSLPRSVQIVTLNLDQGEYKRLRSYLEDQTGKRYHNVTFVNDCATMVVRALEKNTSFRFSRVLDASPSQIAMALSVMKASGDRRVESVRLIAVDRSEAGMSQLFRNLYINTMENKIFVAGFLFNQGWRAWIDATMGDGELQSHDDEVREVIEKKWREETEAFMKVHRKIQPVLDAFDAVVRLAKDDPSRSEKARLVQELLEYSWADVEKRESARAGSALETFQAKTLARYRLEWLETARARIQQELGSAFRSSPAGAPGS